MPSKSAASQTISAHTSESLVRRLDAGDVFDIFLRVVAHLTASDFLNLLSACVLIRNEAFTKCRQDDSDLV